MTDKPPIPRPLWDRIQKFLGTGATGQITLNDGSWVAEKVADEQPPWVLWTVTPFEVQGEHP